MTWLKGGGKIQKKIIIIKELQGSIPFTRLMMMAF
jgi:hypothetical protein